MERTRCGSTAVSYRQPPRTWSSCLLSVRLSVLYRAAPAAPQIRFSNASSAQFTTTWYRTRKQCGAAAAADIMVNTERHVSVRDAWQSLYTAVTTDPPCCFIYALVYDAILLTGVVIEFLTRSSLLDFHFLELNLLFVNSTPISLHVCIDSLRQTFTFVIYNDMANPFWQGMGTRRQWPRPRRDRDVWPHQPRRDRDVQISRRDRDETFAGLETWPRRWSVRLLSLMQYST